MFLLFAWAITAGRSSGPGERAGSTVTVVASDADVVFIAIPTGVEVDEVDAVGGGPVDRGHGTGGGEGDFAQDFARAEP